MKRVILVSLLGIVIGLPGITVSQISLPAPQDMGNHKKLVVHHKTTQSHAAVQHKSSASLSKKANFKYHPTGGRRSLFVSPRSHRWYAYEGGHLVRSGVASTGASYCPDIKRGCRTPQGTFRVIEKRGVGCKSTRFPLGRGGAPMPYCMFFTKNYAVHGSYEVSPNRNISHGCIRIYPGDAEWLNHNFLRIGDAVTVGSY